MYGFTHGLQTIVTHANTVADWRAFVKNAPQLSLDGVISCEESNMLDHMMEKHLHAFSHPVMIFTHESEEDMTAFQNRIALEILPPAKAASRQEEMFENEEEERQDAERAERQKLFDAEQKIIDEKIALFHKIIEARLAAGEDIPEEQRHIIIENPYREKTIGELMGISSSDPYVSNRTPEEEEELQKRIEAAKKNGTMSPDSWGSPVVTAPVKKDKKLILQEGTVEVTKEGEAVDGRAIYRAFNYDVDEEENARREAEQSARDEEKIARLQNMTYEELCEALGTKRYDSVAAGQIIIPEEENRPTRRVSLGDKPTGTTNNGEK